MLLAFYSFTRAFRQAVLTSMFGVVIPCKHTPTCGQRMLVAVRTHSWSAMLQAGKQLVTCI